jgi:hypothetical protein
VTLLIAGLPTIQWYRCPWYQPPRDRTPGLKVIVGVRGYAQDY